MKGNCKHIFIRILILLIFSGITIKGADAAAYFGREAEWTQVQKEAANGKVKILKTILNNKPELLHSKDEDGDTLLHYAAFKGNNEAVSYLISKGLDVNGRGEILFTPLHLAATSGNTETIKLLLSEGADIESKNLYYWTPLYMAVMYDKREAIDYLISQGASVKMIDRSGRTLLHEAAAHDNVKLIKLLLDKGLDVNSRTQGNLIPVHYACMNGKFEAVELLTNRGADLKVVNNEGDTVLSLAMKGGNEKVVDFLISKEIILDSSFRNNEGDTLMHSAAEGGNVNLLKRLTAKGCKVDAKDNWNNTPLFSAVSHGKKEAVEYLISRGANIKVVNNNDETPLMEAARGGYADIAGLLISKGADVNKCRTPGLSSLHFAKNLDTLKVLVENGADINQSSVVFGNPLDKAISRDNVEMVKHLISKGAVVYQGNGNKNLHVAAERGGLKTVKYFVSKGENIHARNNAGETPFLSININKKNVLKYFLSLGADPKARDNEGRNIFHKFAYSYGSRETARMLLESGAEINARDNKGNTPLFYSVKHDRQETFKILLSLGALFSPADVIELVKMKKTDKIWMMIYHNKKVLTITIFLLTVLLAVIVFTFRRKKEKTGGTTIPLLLCFILLISSTARAEENNNLINYSKKDLTPIQQAVVEGDLKTLQDFVKSNPELLRQRDENNNTLLHYAARSGKVKVADYLISNGIDVNAKGQWDQAPLHCAVSTGQLEMVKFLISKNADKEARDEYLDTPLYSAALYGQTEIADYLISTGSNVNTADEMDFFPITVAILRGNSEIVKLLMDNGADLKKSFKDKEMLKDFIAKGGNYKTVILLRKKGIDVDFDVESASGEKLIQYAALKGDFSNLKFLMDRKKVKNFRKEMGYLFPFFVSNGSLEGVKYFASKGIDVNEEHSFRLPLLHAMENNDPEIMKYLISQGADVNRRNSAGLTPLHRAAGKGKTEYVKYLVSHGADINALNMPAETPLFAAIANGHLETAKCIIEKGGNLGSIRGYKYLHVAAMAPNTDCVEYFLSQGEDPNSRDSNGDTPLHSFFSNNYNSNFKIAEALTSAGSDINRQNNTGITPAFKYILNQDFDIAAQKRLIKVLNLGVDVSIQDNQGQTILSRAIEMGKDNFAKILLKHGAYTQIRDIVHIIKHNKKDVLMLVLQYDRRLQLIIGLIISIMLTGLFLIFRSKKTTPPL